MLIVVVLEVIGQRRVVVVTEFFFGGVVALVGSGIAAGPRLVIGKLVLAGSGVSWWRNVIDDPPFDSRVLDPDILRSDHLVQGVKEFLTLALGFRIRRRKRLADRRAF